MIRSSHDPLCPLYAPYSEGTCYCNIIRQARRDEQRLLEESTRELYSRGYKEGFDDGRRR